MSSKERDRLTLLSRVRDGQMTLVQAAEHLDLSYRQAKRVYARFREQGDAGLVHRLRGRPSNHRGAHQAIRGKALALCRERYHDFGPTLAAEYLAKEHAIEVDHETLRRWLIEDGQHKPRRDRSRQHRRWRQRRPCAGELVQMDGSDHDWFEGRRERCTAMVMVDDATGWTYVQLHESETTVAAMLTLRSYIEQRGLPRALYVDKAGIYRDNRKPTAAENLANTGALTQFGRAMKQLEIELICAHSPQAKGRVERANGTLQDRLPKALRLMEIDDIDAANAYLRQTFLPDLNARFAIEPADDVDLHRPAPDAATLADALSIHETRVVGNDYCVQWRGQWLQLVGRDANLGLRRRKITVRQTLGGELELHANGRQLAYEVLEARPSRPANETNKPSAKERVASHKPARKPGPNHVWNKTPAVADGSGRSRCARPPCAVGHSE